MPLGGPHAEVGLKPLLRHRSCETKENELKPLLTTVQLADLHPCDSFYKLSTCGTSEWSMSDPIAKTGLALAAVNFVGTYTRWMG